MTVSLGHCSPIASQPCLCVCVTLTLKSNKYFAEEKNHYIKSEDVNYDLTVMFQIINTYHRLGWLKMTDKWDYVKCVYFFRCNLGATPIHLWLFHVCTVSESTLYLSPNSSRKSKRNLVGGGHLSWSRITSKSGRMYSMIDCCKKYGDRNHLKLSISSSQQSKNLIMIYPAEWWCGTEFWNQSFKNLKSKIIKPVMQDLGIISAS